MDRETIISVLQVSSVVLAVWLCLPQLLSLWRGPRIECGFESGPEEVRPHGCYDLDQDLFDQLVGLGFEPVGVYWEKAKLTRTFHEMVFACRREPGFAVLYPQNQIGPRRASFLTVFTSGAVVFTKNYPGGVEAETDDFIAGMPRREAEPASNASREQGRKQPEPVANLSEDQDRKQPEPPSNPSDEQGPKSSVWALVGFHSLAAGGAAVFSYAGYIKDPSPGWILIGLMAYGGAVLRRYFSTPRAHDAHQTAPADSFDESVRTPPAEVVGEEAGDQRVRQPLSLRTPLAEVHGEHRRRVTRFLLAGHVPVAGITPDSFLEVQRLYHGHPFVLRVFASAERFFLWAKLAFFGIIPGVLALVLGPDHPAPWACLLLEALTLAIVRYGMSSARVLAILGRMVGG